ncbi:MAG TPA: response regulator [Ohtaekwangia sp.]|uniref:response regulator n=1 Tax=Ohtaekwangia sp. TaxID=2066019 RepID=UPI002F93B05B
MSKTIVVIDDSESIRELVGLTLESAGYSVEKGIDGKDALRLFDNREVNLVITDLNMPHIDGIALIREIRKMEAYSMVPILVLTTESQAAKKEEAKAAGATGWIVKPFVAEKLLAVVQKVIR